MEKLELIRLELNGFGRFRGQTFELQGGLNLIEGANEAGKSTLQAFIGGMFYGFFSARSQEAQLHRPAGTLPPLGRRQLPRGAGLPQEGADLPYRAGL